MIHIILKLVFMITITLIHISCGTSRSKFREREVAIAVNINTSNDNDLNMVNLDIYHFKLIDDLQQFQNVELNAVDMDENPEVILNLNIEDFTIWPRDERTSRRTFRRNIVVGTNAQGQPIYQTITATVDITQTRIRSNAHFSTKLTFKDEPPAVFEKSFYSRYDYTNVTVDNIQGDARAVDPRILSAGGIGIEPTTDDFLLELSRTEMVRRLSDELRKRYR